MTSPLMKRARLCSAPHARISDLPPFLLVLRRRRHEIALPDPNEPAADTLGVDEINGDLSTIRLGSPQATDVSPSHRRQLARGRELRGSPEYGGLFALSSLFSVGISEEKKEFIVTVPPISNMYHSAGGVGYISLTSTEKKASARADDGATDTDLFDVIVMRRGKQIKMCVNGFDRLDYTDVAFWEPGLMNTFAAVDELPFSETDGEVRLGWNVPQHWTRTGGQPPDPCAGRVKRSAPRRRSAGRECPHVPGPRPPSHLACSC